MIQHIYPINDVDSHDLESTVCKCEPNVTFLENGDILVIHNSFDGRELLENLFGE